MTTYSPNKSVVRSAGVRIFTRRRGRRSRSRRQIYAALPDPWKLMDREVTSVSDKEAGERALLPFASSTSRRNQAGIAGGARTSPATAQQPRAQSTKYNVRSVVRRRLGGYRYRNLRKAERYGGSLLIFQSDADFR